MLTILDIAKRSIAKPFPPINLKHVLLCLILSTTACTNNQIAPTMLDYSYVPPNTSAKTQNFGIDDL